MASFFFRIVEFLTILWLVRMFVRTLFGGPTQPTNQGPVGGNPFASATSGRQSSARERVVMGGEMKKDPQCGTYVSTELSIKRKVDGETIHFCSTACEEEYLRASSTNPAKKA